ncbi:MAG TPA: DUF1572 family protein [Terriglobia bacterium]|nr:DUF1572 family protein [Terriglobia bacterium]
MRTTNRALARQLVAEARHSLEKVYLPRITRCLGMLSDEDIWWRPHPTSNSAGNMVLHLAGNVRQWIVSGLGGALDVRQRDEEFAETGPLPRRALAARLRAAVKEAGRVLARLDASELARERMIQGFRVTGCKAVFHVTEHFAYHTGQIIFVTKLKRGEDLKFTRLPGDKRKSARLPAV